MPVDDGMEEGADWGTEEKEAHNRKRGGKKQRKMTGRPGI